MKIEIIKEAGKPITWKQLKPKMKKVLDKDFEQWWWEIGDQWGVGDQDKDTGHDVDFYIRDFYSTKAEEKPVEESLNEDADPKYITVQRTKGDASDTSTLAIDGETLTVLGVLAHGTSISFKPEDAKKLKKWLNRLIGE